MATPSPERLIGAGWVEAGTHVHTLGRKGGFQGECPWALVEAVDVLVSDSLDQLEALEVAEQPWTRGRPVTPLGAVVVGAATGRRGDADITLYASVGLAGNDVVLANHVLRLSATAAG